MEVNIFILCMCLKVFVTLSDCFKQGTLTKLSSLISQSTWTGWVCTFRLFTAFQSTVTAQNTIGSALCTYPHALHHRFPLPPLSATELLAAALLYSLFASVHLVVTEAGIFVLSLRKYVEWRKILTLPWRNKCAQYLSTYPWIIISREHFKYLH